MGASFIFATRIGFSAENAETILRDIPASPGVFALYGTGLEADLWSLVLLAIGVAIRWVCRLSYSRAGSNQPAVVSPAALPE